MARITGKLDDSELKDNLATERATGGMTHKT